jgi:5'-methylthioadenosine phosphorylase
MNSESSQPVIGIIGGTGLYAIDGIDWKEEIIISTPFGEPSAPYRIGYFNGKKIIFLQRHGKGHFINPSNIPFRANIYGMKVLGVKRILSVSAVGSMKEEIKPGDLVLVSQFIDRTYKRETTFFNEGLAIHVAIADPVCPQLGGILKDCAAKLRVPFHPDRTYICIEGPQFSTRGESFLYRSWNVDVVGMTNATEAKLAREAEICYSTIAVSTDYDCWNIDEEKVTVELVIENLNKGAERARSLIRDAIASVPAENHCSCGLALKGAMITDPKVIAPRYIEKYRLFLEKYL